MNLYALRAGKTRRGMLVLALLAAAVGLAATVTTAVAGGGAFNHPGNILIADQFNNRVILVDHRGHLLAQYGNLNTPGFGLDDTGQGLNAPYDAKVIGDYTGITPPFDDDDDGDD
jgi:hypothetical protein